jgi:hypothetical protein
VPGSILRLGLTIFLAGPLAAVAHADGPSRHPNIERSGWWWNGYRPDVYYSAPPVIYPSLGYIQQPERQPATLEDFRVPLLSR